MLCLPGKALHIGPHHIGPHHTFVFYIHIGITSACIYICVMIRIKANRYTVSRLTRIIITVITGQNKKPKVRTK